MFCFYDWLYVFQTVSPEAAYSVPFDIAPFADWLMYPSLHLLILPPGNPTQIYSKD